jgi:hypothetical protein
MSPAALQNIKRKFNMCNQRSPHPSSRERDSVAENPLFFTQHSSVASQPGLAKLIFSAKIKD